MTGNVVTTFTDGQVLFGNQINSGFAQATSTAALADSSTSTLGAALVGYKGRSLATRFGETVNVKDYGAKADHSTDDSAAINAAIIAVFNAGGGTVYLPRGYYATASTINLYTGVMLRGDGVLATVIGGSNGTTHNIIQSKDYATLVGTNTNGGPNKFGLADLSVDGNKFNRTTGGGVLFYGYQYVIDNVEIYNNPGVNFYSEWATYGGSPANSAPANDFMESHITRLRSFAAGTDGIVFNGPHDTIFMDTQTYVNGRYGANIGQGGAYTAGGTMLVQFHSYGNGQDGLIVGTQVFGSVIESESNLSVGGITITSTGVLVASTVLAWGNTGYGISINSALNQISTLSAFSNSADGIAIFGAANVLTNVITHDNGGLGINSNASSDKSVIDGGSVYSNTGFGVSLQGNFISATGLTISTNTGGGMSLINGIGGTRVVATFAANTGTQLALNVMGAANSIDANIFTTTGQTAWSGTIGSNCVRLATSGTSINSVSTNAGPNFDAPYAVASLPTATIGATAFATNGRNTGEGAGVGKGCPVFVNSSAVWCAVWSGVAVTA